MTTDEQPTTTAETKPNDAPAVARESGRGAESEPGDDAQRGEITIQDLDDLEGAVENIDFATRRATPELLSRLRGLSTRLVDLIDQIEKGVRKRPDVVPLKPEDEAKLKALLDEGVTLGESGKLDVALAKLEEAQKLDPENPEVLFNLGVLYGMLAQANYARGEFYDSRVRDEVWTEKGEFCYERVLELQPDNVSALNNLASLYQLQGETDVAVETLVKSLSIQADQPDAKKHLEELDPDGEIRKSLKKDQA